MSNNSRHIYSVVTSPTPTDCKMLSSLDSGSKAVKRFQNILNTSMAYLVKIVAFENCPTQKVSKANRHARFSHWERRLNDVSIISFAYDNTFTTATSRYPQNGLFVPLQEELDKLRCRSVDMHVFVASTVCLDLWPLTCDLQNLIWLLVAAVEYSPYVSLRLLKPFMRYSDNERTTGG